jgi:hypothetical protein
LIFAFGGSHDQDRFFAAGFTGQSLGEQSHSFSTQHTRKKDADFSRLPVLLRARDERKRRGTSNKRSELTPSHMIHREPACGTQL